MMSDFRNIVKGCIYGGAIGDALGYAIEFDRENEIFSKYGENGIQKYEYNQNGEALISDDTQMTLFTAEAIVYAKKNNVSVRQAARQAYIDWLITQLFDYKDRTKIEEFHQHISWLSDMEGLYVTRYPGNTCLHSLIEPNKTKAVIEDYISDKRNNSKGCGGIMRCAPVGLCLNGDIRTTDMEAAQLSAITHCHSLGYMPSAVLAHIINRITFSQNGQPLKEIILDAQKTVSEIFENDENLSYLNKIIDLSIELSENSENDLDNIHKIGGGWVGEETLGIAIYCSLRYENDFSKAVCVSVNHSGDSDSTGAVLGNILGAWLGFNKIEDKWKKRLELSDVLSRVCDDICNSFDN